MVVRSKGNRVGSVKPVNGAADDVVVVTVDVDVGDDVCGTMVKLAAVVVRAVAVVVVVVVVGGGVVTGAVVTGTPLVHQRGRPTVGRMSVILSVGEP